MKPHPRIRKTIKWGGAAVTLLLVVVWIGSGCVWWQVWNSPTLTVFLDDGCVCGNIFESDWLNSSAPWTLTRVSQPRAGSRGFEMRLVPLWAGGGGLRAYFVPIWMPLAGCLALTALAWRLDALAHRRARVGFCPKCQYDRAGLAAGAVCPECGAAPAGPEGR